MVILHNKKDVLRSVLFSAPGFVALEADFKKVAAAAASMCWLKILITKLALVVAIMWRLLVRRARTETEEAQISGQLLLSII